MTDGKRILFLVFLKVEDNRKVFEKSNLANAQKEFDRNFLLPILSTTFLFS